MISQHSSMKALSQPSQSSSGQYQRPLNLTNNAKYVQISLMPASPLYGPPLSNSRQRPHSSSNTSLRQQYFQPQVQYQQSQQKLNQQAAQQQQLFQVGQQNSFQQSNAYPQFPSSQSLQFQQIAQQYPQVAPQQQQQLQAMERGSSTSLFSSSQSLQPRVFHSVPQQQQAQPRYQILQLKGVNIPSTTNEAHITALPSLPVAPSHQTAIPIKQLKYEDSFRRQRLSEQIQSNQFFDQNFQSPIEKSRSNSLPRTEPTELLATSQVKMVPIRLQDRFASPQLQGYAPNENDEGRQLLAELTSIHHGLNRSMEDYQLAFSSKRMTSTEISKHKSQFRQKIQETHTNCSKLIQNYPRIFPYQQLTSDGQQQFSLKRATPGSTYYEREINHLLDIMDETYNQYMIVPHKIASQNMLPVGLQKTDEDLSFKNVLHHQKQESSSNDFNNSISSIGLYSPIVKAFPNIHQIDNIHQVPSQQLNITAFTQNNYIQNNFQSDLTSKEFSQVENHVKSTPFNESIPPYSSYFTGKQELQGIKNYTQDIESIDYLTNEYEPKKYAFTTVDEYLNKISSPASNQDYTVKDYTYMTDYGNKKTEGTNMMSLNNQTQSSQVATTPLPPPSPAIQNYFSGDSYLKKETFSTNQFGIDDYKPLTLREKEGISSITQAKNNIIETQTKQLQLQLQEKNLRDETKSLEKFEQKLDQQVCEYSYEMLSEMDRKIIEIKCTIQQALEQADMPMTKQLLIEVLDSLASTANTADQSLAVKAIQKIHDNATRLHSDNSTSYNLYIYLQKISNFLKSRANILELSSQAHELSLLNQTNASFWSPDYMDRHQNTENYQVKKEQQNIQSYNNTKNTNQGVSILPPPDNSLKITQYVLKDTNDVPNYVPMKIDAGNQETNHIPVVQTTTFNYLTQEKQEWNPSHYSPLTLKKPEESITSSISQQPIVLEQLHAQESSLSNQIRLHTAEVNRGQLGISSQDSSRRVSLFQQRQLDNESKSSNSQMLSSVPYVIQNDYISAGGNMEQSGRPRIQSYAISNQISELNQAKQVAAQASAQEELLEAQVPGNITRMNNFSQKFQSELGSYGNQISFAKVGGPSAPLAQDAISNNFKQENNINTTNAYHYSPIFSQDKSGSASVPQVNDNNNQNQLKQNTNTQIKEKIYIDLNDDINNINSYQYSSSRPPARTRGISSETNSLNQQFQKSNQLRNKEVSLTLTTQQSTQKQEQPNQTAVGQLNTPWQTDLSFTGNSNQKYTTNPSAYQITRGAGTISTTQQPRTIGIFDIPTEVSKQTNQYISEAGTQLDSNKNLQKSKMKFFDTAVGLKEQFPRNHPAHNVLISQLWETARVIPEPNWEQFILTQYNSAKN